MKIEGPKILGIGAGTLEFHVRRFLRGGQIRNKGVKNVKRERFLQSGADIKDSTLLCLLFFTALLDDVLQGFGCEPAGRSHQNAASGIRGLLNRWYPVDREGATLPAIMTWHARSSRIPRVWLGDSTNRFVRHR